MSWVQIPAINVLRKTTLETLNDKHPILKMKREREKRENAGRLHYNVN